MDNTLAVERRSIDVIPDSERHGSVRSLFTVWFSANMQITTVATGAVAIVVGASLPWAVLALVLGNLIGAVFMALHSAQGPKLGIPQMIQSRAQFGFYGAIVPLLLVVLMYVGFFAASAVLGGSALASWWHIGRTPATIIVAAICTALAIYGYRLIHAYERWIALVSGIGFLYLTIRLFTQYHVGSAWHAGHFAFGTFLLVMTLAITWQITYAPYVADYSRYLPKNTPVSATFWWTYAGTVIGTIWMMVFGSIAASVATNTFGGGSVSFFIDLGGSGAHWLFAIVIILGVVAVNVLNLYGMFMCVTTTVTALRPLQVRSQVRMGFILFSAVVGTIVALAATSSFLGSFQNFILFLAYFMIPWTAINLTDFYFVRKEQYDMNSIFRPDGIYGRVNIRTIVAYVVAVLVEIPFMSTTFYTGPLVRHLGGADISWIFGLIVAAGLYYILMRPVAGVPSLYEFAGGEKAFLALAAAHHARCLADPDLNHPFTHPGQHPQHVERLGLYWAEVMGGPPRYSSECGDQASLLYMHSGIGAMDDLGKRFVECFVLAQDDAGLPDDPEFRAALRAYMEWAVGQVMAVSPHGSVVPDGLPMPHWSWDGLAEA